MLNLEACLGNGGMEAMGYKTDLAVLLGSPGLSQPTSCLSMFEVYDTIAISEIWDHLISKLSRPWSAYDLLLTATLMWLVSSLIGLAAKFQQSCK